MRGPIGEKIVTETIEETLELYHGKEQWQESEYLAERVQDVCRQYMKERGISPFPWQERVIRYLGFVALVFNQNTVVDIPTGYGKSTILACLAKIIIDADPECKVYIVTMNDYLLLTAFQEFSWRRLSGKYPE